jgi:hypothetical protein
MPRGKKCPSTGVFVEKGKNYEPQNSFVMILFGMFY